MSTLGLSGPARQDDGFFRRLFWPTIENQYDVDTTSRRGFWLAAVVGTFSALVLLLGAAWGSALLVLVTYWMGATGIRERSLAAAILLLLMYLVNTVYVWIGILIGAFPFRNPLVGIVGIALLLSCVRAAMLSRGLADSGDLDLPDRGTETLVDRIADRMPPVVWPRVRIPFFVMVGILLSLTVAGNVLTLARASRATARVPSSASRTP